ncbi:hypothetical protein KSP40_PGU016161 [Platanthera guangdongensis]|uniref:Uncharacterized protein n=1 Tax=Platanthera guangdongensis TaxID=2320717 RepID=A0ABR2ML84_9ASPA
MPKLCIYKLNFELLIISIHQPMEFWKLGSQVNDSLPSYWRRRARRRGAVTKKKKNKAPAVIRLGGRTRRWRSWKLAVRPILRLAWVRVLPPPANAMKKLRDAYTDAMLVLSGRLSANNGGGWGTVWDRRIPRGREEGLKYGDFEKRLQLHLYNSVIATR